MGDFCSPACYKDYVDKHPGFENRGKPNHCNKCGSDKIQIIKVTSEVAQIGNILSGEKPSPHNVNKKSYKCSDCKYEGEDWIIEGKTEKLGANKENSSEKPDYHEN
jgi:DNA-directed RNA polymerase subunit RPC12/RpoP